MRLLRRGAVWLAIVAAAALVLLLLGRFSTAGPLGESWASSVGRAAFWGAVIVIAGLPGYLVARRRSRRVATPELERPGVS